jgi:hypothetical protein
MPVNCTRLKPETLLRRLASDKNITGSVRLRAIELLILIENTAGLAKQMKPIKEIKQSELNSLTAPQTTEYIENGQLAHFHYDGNGVRETLSAAP